MSSVETPTPPPEPQPPQPPAQPAGRHCPRCGASMTDEQEWCLNCGASVGTRVVPAPGWRVPIAVVATLAVVGAIAIAIAIIQLADDTGEVTQGTAQVTPTPSAVVPTPTPGAEITPTPTIPEASGQATPEPTPSATPEPTPSPSGGNDDIGVWPPGKDGWTVVLASTKSESSANDKAENYAGDGISDVGILRSDNFNSLNPGYWVVFSGTFDSQSQASDALDGIDAPDAYIRRIEPN